MTPGRPFASSEAQKHSRTPSSFRPFQHAVRRGCATASACASPTQQLTTCCASPVAEDITDADISSTSIGGTAEGCDRSRSGGQE